MRVYQKHAGDDAKLLIKFHWPYSAGADPESGKKGGGTLLKKVEEQKKKKKRSQQ